MQQLWTQAKIEKALGSLVVEVKGRTGRPLTDVSTDSRHLSRGAVFVALKGDKFDGHDYAAAAQRNGAELLIVERPIGTPVPEIIVTDTAEAYGALARAWRSQFAIPLICVVGSNGKTTTTQMIASILRVALGTEAMLATEGNYNNSVGVPRTLLRLTSDMKAAVVEAGISHPGEMAQLISWIRPTVVVVTNAQREHQEFLDGVEASARENGMAIVSLSGKGTAVLPADDASLPIWINYARARGCEVLTYAEGETAIHAPVRAVEKNGTVSLVLPSGERQLELKTAGRHAVHDAAAAAAAAAVIGVSPEAIEEGLRCFEPVAGRGRRFVLRSGAVLIDDAYNANPDSMRAAIDMLSHLSSPRVLVAGDMGEIGKHAHDYHVEIGRYAREHGIDRFLAVGEEMKAAAEAFGAGARYYDNTAALIKAVLDEAQTPGTVLVKASHYMKLDAVVTAVVGEYGISSQKK